MITIRYGWIALLVLFLVMLLIVLFAAYWQYTTGMNTLHVLALIPFGDVGHGC